MSKLEISTEEIQCSSVDYSTIMEFAKKLSREWEELEWDEIKLAEGEVLHLHLDWEELKGKAGLYKIVWLKPRVSSFTIMDELVNVDNALGEIVLSIGKSKNLYRRLGQDHFGSSPKSNRLRQKLQKLFQEEDIGYSKLAEFVNNGEIKLFYTENDIWWQRDLLEAYGRTRHACLFDLSIEH